MHGWLCDRLSCGVYQLRRVPTGVLDAGTVDITGEG
jgi:hypothetical protein